MSNFDLLKTKLRREPFRPFIIEFLSGSTLLIDAETELLFPKKRPELVIAFTEGGLQHEFEQDVILRIIEAT